MQGNNPVHWVSHLPVRTISAQSLSNKSRWPRNVPESKDNDESFCCFSSRLKETNRCESEPALPVLRTERGMSMHCHPRLVSYRCLVRNPPGVAFLSTFYPFTAVFQYAAQLVLNPAGQTQDIQPGGCETESKHFFLVLVLVCDITCTENWWAAPLSGQRAEFACSILFSMGFLLYSCLLLQSMIYMLGWLLIIIFSCWWSNMHHFNKKVYFIFYFESVTAYCQPDATNFLLLTWPGAEWH